MNRSTSAEHRFASSVEEAWEALVDIESYPVRTTSYVEITPLTDSVRGMGARWEQTRTVWGRNHTQTMEVVEWKPPTSYALRASEAGACYETRYELTGGDGGTIVRASFTVTPTSLFGRAVTRLMGEKLMRSTGEALDQILAELNASLGEESE